MSIPTPELLHLLDLETLDEDLFRGAQPTTGWQRTFGGQVLAQALVAAARTVAATGVGSAAGPTPRRLHSLHATFLRPGHNDSPIVYDVERLRDGGTFSTRLVRARQAGRQIFTGDLSFKRGEDGLSHSAPVPARPADPRSCPSLASAVHRMLGHHLPALWDAEALDMRYVGRGPELGDPHDDTHIRLWVRSTGRLPDDPVLHQAVLAYLSDVSLLTAAVLPHAHELSRGLDVHASSIDHAMWFHRPARADEWLLFDEASPSASDGMGLSTGRLMQHGRVVATCCQEGLLRVTRPDR